MGSNLLAYDAEEMLRAATAKHNIHLSVLIADTALWANPAVHKWLLSKHLTGAMFPDRRRYKAGKENRGETVNGIRFDDNSYANVAIKRAIGLHRSQLVGFEACHIWPKTCYDERYHTVIANLVLLPRALASLTDHDAEIQAALQFRSFELYGWHPAECSPPQRPAFYPADWRPPFGIPRLSTGELRTDGKPEFQRVRNEGRAVGARDYTKYLFQNQVYGKNRLVLAVVKAHVRANPGISLVQLQTAFPDSLQGSLGVIRPLNPTLESAELQRRYFFKPDERLRIGGGRDEAVVCTQWGTGNIGRFLDQAASLGFQIEPEP